MEEKKQVSWSVDQQIEHTAWCAKNTVVLANTQCRRRGLGPAQRFTRAPVNIRPIWLRDMICGSCRPPHLTRKAATALAHVKLHAPVRAKPEAASVRNWRKGTAIESNPREPSA